MTRISYAFIALCIFLVGFLELGTPFLTVLFSYFALSKLRIGQSKPVALILYLLLVATIFYGFVFFLQQAFVALPNIASTAVPLVLQYAREHGVELPFDDLDSLKAVTIDTVRSQLKYLGNFAKLATKEFVFLALGIVVAVSLFLNAKVDLDREERHLKNNLYSLAIDEIVARFRTFYRSFSTVMGAQMVISTINTGLTSIFVLAIGLPYAGIVIVVTFLCGLLPIIGNIISNSVIVGIAITISLKLAIWALIFLVVLHKFEYFLNSKIIGDKIKNPVWLTLIALILGEKLMGIPGMILAPVILHYLKAETTQVEVNRTSEQTFSRELEAYK